MDVSGVLSGLMTLGGNEPYLLWLVVFAAAVFAVAGADSLRRQDALRQRLGSRNSGSDVSGDRSLVYGETDWSWLRSLEPIYRPFTPSGSEVATDVRRRLTEAGMRNPHAVEVFFALRILLSLALGIGAIVLLSLLFTKLKVLPLMALAFGAASIGYLLPGYVVTRRANTRKRLITEGFPDALDMLLVCVEAGLSLEAAIQRVGQEIRAAHPVISDEFQLVGNEMLAGKGRHDALRSLGARTGVADVNGLASLLIQSDQFGTSVARALRVHAAEMRTTRILRAEERAHKIPVKLAFPLMFGLIPVVLIVTLAPGIIRVVEVLLPMMKSAGKLSH
jgi:tight adherence protein C